MKWKAPECIFQESFILVWRFFFAINSWGFPTIAHTGRETGKFDGACVAQAPGPSCLQSPSLRFQTLGVHVLREGDMLIQKDACPCVDRTRPDATCGLIAEMPIPLFRGFKTDIYICYWVGEINWESGINIYTLLYIK